jgi:hypothetical protein
VRTWAPGGLETWSGSSTLCLGWGDGGEGELETVRAGEDKAVLGVPEGEEDEALVWEGGPPSNEKR